MTPTIFRSWKLDITLPPTPKNKPKANKQRKGMREWQTRTGNNCMDGTAEKCDKRDLWGRCNLKSGNRRLAVTAAQYQALRTNAMKANGRKQSDDPKCRQRRKEIIQSHGAWMLNVCSGRLYKELRWCCKSCSLAFEQKNMAWNALKTLLVFSYTDWPRHWTQHTWPVVHVR